MGTAEVTFAERFTSGTQQQAMAAPRPIRQTTPHSLTGYGRKMITIIEHEFAFLVGFVWRHPFHLKQAKIPMHKLLLSVQKGLIHS
jgi:hypothetical protein